MKFDIVIGLSSGDEAKGKVTQHLLVNNKYTHCLRIAGGQNCGHTFYINDKKFVTHSIPAGIFYNVKSIIGSNCVVHPKSFIKELEEFVKQGFDSSLIKIAHNAHIVTDAHIEEDLKDTIIGTTKKGIGPAYRDKYSRCGKRAESINELKEFIVDVYDELFIKNIDPVILGEGAQGFELDISSKTYPYVTSSHTTVAGALLNGIPHTAVRNVYGVAKCYTTYVGAMKFQPDGDQNLVNIQKTGFEVGATTGRVRQCNYLDLNQLDKAVNVNGVNVLIFNKTDVLKELNVWKIIENNKIIDLISEDNFISHIKEKFKRISNIIFSYSPYEI